MAQYKEKPLVLQAIPVTKILTNAVIPPWVTAKMTDGDIIKLPDNTITVKTPQGKRIGIDGDMLIENMIGELSLMPSVKFLALYEKVGN